MASEERGRQRASARGGRTKPGKSASAGSTTRELRLRTDPRSERRFEPKVAPMTIVTVVAACLASVALGAGAYAKLAGGGEEGTPHRYASYAPYLLAAGAFVLVAVALFGQRPALPVRIGDAGVALEKSPTDLERIGWNEITGVLLGGDLLTVQGSGTSIALSLAAHPEAAALFIAEARRRVPQRLSDKALAGLDLPVAAAAGEPLALEPPQIAGQRCRSSDKLIAFERDARLCGRCGELYHKDGVPQACVTCGAALR
jgi:hypothetical protein